MNNFVGVSTTEGEHWERQRNFFHDHLTDLVDGKGAKGFHEVIMDEIQDMKLSLAAKVNYKPMSTSQLVVITFASVDCCVFQPANG